MRSNPTTADPKLLQEALKELRNSYGADVTIVSVDPLSNETRRNVILRLNLHGSTVPTSVILKQSLPMKGDPGKSDAEIKADNARVFSRFARDWAGLEFANSIGQTIHNVPRFYGSNKDLRFILIEDLGHPHVSLVDSLTASNRENAIIALGRYMKALGSFHAASLGKTEQYETILKGIDPAALTAEEEWKDISSWMANRLAKLLSEKVGLSISENEIKAEVNHILEGIFKSGPFTTLTHGDIAPDNVFDHQEDLQLIDFEWCAARNALLDATYLRMSIPTGWCANVIPDDVIREAEKIYRNELSISPKEESLYRAAYTQACAFHLFQQIMGIEGCLKNDKRWNDDASVPTMPEGCYWDDKINLLRPRFITRLQTFIDVSTENDLYPVIRQMASDLLKKLHDLWPDARPLNTYRAFTVSPTSTHAMLMEKGVAKKSGEVKIESTESSPQIPKEKSEKTQEKQQIESDKSQTYRKK